MILPDPPFFSSNKKRLYYYPKCKDFKVECSTSCVFIKLKNLETKKLKSTTQSVMLENIVCRITVAMIGGRLFTTIIAIMDSSIIGKMMIRKSYLPEEFH